MNAQEIRAMSARVLADIAPEADLSTVADDADLREALDLDSMDFLNFTIGLGQESGVTIREEDAPRLRTLAGIEAYFSCVARTPSAA
jgi:acyl carrier protein